MLYGHMFMDEELVNCHFYGEGKWGVCLSKEEPDCFLSVPKGGTRFFLGSKRGRDMFFNHGRGAGVFFPKAKGEPDEKKNNCALRT